MNAKNKPGSRVFRKRLVRRFRLLKVYRTLLRVGLSYLWISLAGGVRGECWKARRMAQVHRHNARRVERMILEVKGLFVKIGQLLSILTNFLPEAFRGELEGVQDQVPARPLAEIRTRIHEELGRDVDELFASFQAEPIASASLAQVHEASLTDGRRLAVKIQHLDIEEIAEVDLRTLRRVMRLAGFFLRLRGLDRAYGQIREMILEELDFRREADNIREITTNFADEPDLSFPEVVDELCSGRILTTHFMEGIKITDLAAIQAAGFEREELAKRILNAYCRMLFEHRLYHADPHPGNILVAPGGRLVFLDFGAVGRISPQMRDGMSRFLEAVLRRDRQKIQEALRAMGFIACRTGDEVGERIVSYVQRRFLEQVPLESWNLKDIHMDLQTKMEMIADFRHLDISLRDLTSAFQIPREWVVLQRTLLLLVGLTTHLYPRMNPMTTIRPFLNEAVLGDRDWKKLVSGLLKDLLLSAITIPDELKRLLARANGGELEIRVKGFRERSRLVYALGHQFLFGLLAMGSGILAYVARTGSDVTVAGMATKATVFFTMCLGLSIFTARKWR